MLRSVGRGEYMGQQFETGEWKESWDDPTCSVRYKLKLELRRIERRGAGLSPYASTIREVLWVLAHGENEHIVEYLEQELNQPFVGDSDEPYAPALRRVVEELDKRDKSAHELFTYYLRRLERQGRGDEPFAQAVREALASNDVATLSALLRRRGKDLE